MFEYPISTVRLELSARSDIGRNRRRNEDAYFAGGLSGADGWTLLAVADGLGGHARGDWASSRTLELLAVELGPLLTVMAPDAALREAVRRINWQVRAEARTLNAVGAATTLVLSLFHGLEYWWLNIGDSRLYFHGPDGLRQLSRDHSWVQDQVEQGLLDPAETRLHPYRNVVTRTIGFELAVDPDIRGPFTLAESETLLACSDGLFGPVADAAIAGVLGAYEPGEATRRLIELANEAGGPDNITVVVARAAGS